MKLLTLGFFLLAFTFNSFAAQTKVCVITNDIETEITHVMVETNSAGLLDSIRLYTVDGNKIVSDEYHPIDNVVADGLVASERQGYKIVTMKVSGFNAALGGTISLNILSNALKGSKFTYKMKLSKVGNKFVLFSPEGKQINRLHMLGNRIPIIGAVGIKEVRASLSN